MDTFSQLKEYIEEINDFPFEKLSKNIQISCINLDKILSDSSIEVKDFITYVNIFKNEIINKSSSDPVLQHLNKMLNIYRNV